MQVPLRMSSLSPLFRLLLQLISVGLSVFLLGENIKLRYFPVLICLSYDIDPFPISLVFKGFGFVR